MLTITLTILFLVSWRYSQAQNVNLYYCPQHGYIAIGDSMSQVAKNCGKATSVRTYKEPKTEEVTLENWIYQRGYETNYRRHGVKGPDGRIYSRTVTTYGIPMLISFKDDKVHEIRTLGNIVPSTYYCNRNEPIQIGDSKSDVTSICGSPYSIEYADVTAESEGDVEVTEWTYQFQFPPVIILRFEDGILTSIEKKF